MMMFFVALCAILCASTASSQLVPCDVEDQCREGFYCETSIHICRECLSCKDLFRQTLPSLNCVKSIDDCGPCLDGRVSNHRGDLECVILSDTTDGNSYYIWALIVGIVLLLLFFAAIISICLFKGKMLKISTRTWLRQSCDAELHATAPEPPPPYNPYSPVRPDSPYTNNMHIESETRDDELSHPFIKRAPADSRPDSGRESSGNQNAVVYDKPNYMRPIVNMPSPDDGPPNSPIHDENTTESDWTPTTTSVSNVDGPEPISEPATGTKVNSNDGLSSMLAAARDTTLVEPPPKRMCHDTNNNGNNDTVIEGPSTSTALTPAMFVNIQVNNTVGTAYSGQLIRTNKS